MHGPDLLYYFVIIGLGGKSMRRREFITLLAARSPHGPPSGHCPRPQLEFCRLSSGLGVIKLRRKIAPPPQRPLWRRLLCGLATRALALQRDSRSFRPQGAPPAYVHHIAPPYDQKHHKFPAPDPPKGQCVHIWQYWSVRHGGS